MSDGSAVRDPIPSQPGDLPADQLARMMAILSEYDLPALEEELRESLGNARALAELQEVGWTPLGGGSSSDQVASRIDRADVNTQARWYYFKDPIAQQAVMLHNAYTFGRGVGYRAAHEDVQAWLDRFWKDQRNRASLTRALPQWLLNRERQLDGELFLAFFVSTLTGRVTVRTFDPGEITQVITAPGDPLFPLYFRREYLPREYDFATGHYKTGDKRVEIYPDFRNAGDEDGHYPAAVTWPTPTTRVYVMHVCTNPLAGRGLSHLATGLPWIKAHKGFMEDRATLTLALATFAFKQKVKGNRQSMSRMLQQWGRYETAQRYSRDDRERRQGGNTLVENEASELEQLKTDSGASNAYQDARMMRQLAGIGSGGIFEHYLGDPSTGNLATATAMELPMLKMFEFEQQLWEDLYGDIFWFVTLMGLLYSDTLRGLANVSRDLAGGTGLWEIEPLEEGLLDVEVRLPAIVQRDLAGQSTALASIAQAETSLGQQIVPAEQMATYALQLLGFDDVGKIVAQMKADGFKLSGQPPAAAGQQFGAAMGEAFARKLKEAADKPPEIGDPLPKKDGEKVNPIKKSEVEQAFDDFAALPELGALLKKLELTLEDVDEVRHA